MNYFTAGSTETNRLIIIILLILVNISFYHFKIAFDSFVFKYRMDATLREITGLVKEVNPDARSKGTYFDFSLVTPELRNSGYRMREIGVTCSGQKGADDNKTLAQAR